ncbi:hypothetical protein GCM10011611_29480 [Aliidongia dinghuensis]|uniref:Uncharacterized protein n=1 Tax=Aliidongia dinghuensis TaxID=1867774 RepID=A0A8J2YTY9_9PROT|nr:hypothetical protein GCM10011611_29480 [Aliidongia dinghuensis]
MVPGLILARPGRGHALVPFVAVAVDRVDVDHDATERVKAMAQNLADGEFGGRRDHFGADAVLETKGTGYATDMAPSGTAVKCRDPAGM